MIFLINVINHGNHYNHINYGSDIALSVGGDTPTENKQVACGLTPLNYFEIDFID
jgi:hypothetical protein